MKISKLAVLALLAISSSAFAQQGLLGQPSLTMQLTCPSESVTLQQLINEDFSPKNEQMAKTDSTNLQNNLQTEFGALGTTLDNIRATKTPTNLTMDQKTNIQKDVMKIHSTLAQFVPNRDKIATQMCEMANFMRDQRIPMATAESGSGIKVVFVTHAV